jgi:hypothetical protein
VADDCQRVLGIRGSAGEVTCLFEVKGETAAHECVIVNEEDGSRHGISLHPIEFEVCDIICYEWKLWCRDAELEHSSGCHRLSGEISYKQD